MNFVLPSSTVLSRVIQRALGFPGFYGRNRSRPPVQALGQSGVIQGSITDPQGAVIPSVRVTALDEAKLVIVRETVSGRDGSFQLRPLLPGAYTVRAEMKGFK